MKRTVGQGDVSTSQGGAAAVESSFAEVVGLVERARLRAYQAVNQELVGLYWQIGQTISQKVAAAEWGEGVVDRLSQHLALKVPGLRGFSAQNLWRMRQFFEAYCDDEKLSSLVRVLPWTHNLIILGQCKRSEEREFYLRQVAQERWSKRELERQLRLGSFERTVLSPPKLSPAARDIHGPGVLGAFKDVYAVEFLDLPVDHTEAEHLGKLNFYLEALGRDVRKPHENPAMGVLLCASKDSEVVEYALSRSLSPALVAQYQTQLPDKQVLAAKLHEFYALNKPHTP